MHRSASASTSSGSGHWPSLSQGSARNDMRHRPQRRVPQLQLSQTQTARPHTHTQTQLQQRARPPMAPHQQQRNHVAMTATRRHEQTTAAAAAARSSAPPASQPTIPPPLPPPLPPAGGLSLNLSLSFSQEMLAEHQRQQQHHRQQQQLQQPPARLSLREVQPPPIPLLPPLVGHEAQRLHGSSAAARSVRFSPPPSQLSGLSMATQPSRSSSSSGRSHSQSRSREARPSGQQRAPALPVGDSPAVAAAGASTTQSATSAVIHPSTAAARRIAAATPSRAPPLGVGIAPNPVLQASGRAAAAVAAGQYSQPSFSLTQPSLSAASHRALQLQPRTHTVRSSALPPPVARVHPDPIVIDDDSEDDDDGDRTEQVAEEPADAVQTQPSPPIPPAPAAIALRAQQRAVTSGKSKAAQAKEDDDDFLQTEVDGPISVFQPPLAHNAKRRRSPSPPASPPAPAFPRSGRRQPPNKRRRSSGLGSGALQPKPGRKHTHTSAGLVVSISPCPSAQCPCVAFRCVCAGG